MAFIRPYQPEVRISSESIPRVDTSPGEGFEPSTLRLTAGCSTAKLPGQKLRIFRLRRFKLFIILAENKDKLPFKFKNKEI